MEQRKPSPKREDGNRPEWKPIVEFFTTLSEDGRYVICKTIITAIKPIRYFEKVMEGKRPRADSQSTEAHPPVDQSQEKPDDRGD